MNRPFALSLQSPDQGIHVARHVAVAPASCDVPQDAKPGRCRIVHICDRMDDGATERFLVEFARRIDRAKFDLHFISLQAGGEAAKRVQDLGWPITTLGVPSGFRPDAVISLSRRLRQLEADVIHTHNSAGFHYGVPASVLARIGSVIHTRHGQRFETPKRQTLSFRWLSHWVDQVVSICEDGRRRTLEEGIPADRTCTIRTGIDASLYPFVGPTQGGPAVLIAGLCSERETEGMIRAIAVAHGKRRIHEPRVRLRIIGDGIDRPSLRALTQQLGLESSIEFAGPVVDIGDALQGASMFVLPSVNETTLLPLLETMSCGLPVVTSHGGGNPDVVIPQSTGLLVPPRDPETMADAMLELWRDPTAAKRYGLEGRQRVELEFGIQRMIHSYESLYLAGSRSQ